MKHKNLGKMLGITLAAVSMFAGSVGAAEAVEQTEKVLETEAEVVMEVEVEAEVDQVMAAAGIQEAVMAGNPTTHLEAIWFQFRMRQVMMII